MKLLFIFLFIFVGFGSLQSQSVDSIQENRIKQYHLLIESTLKRGQWDKVIAYGDTMYFLSRQINYTRGITMALLYKGEANLSKGDYSMAYQSYNKCLLFIDSCGCEKDLSDRLYMGLHILFVIQNKQDSIKKYTDLIADLPCDESSIVVKDYIARQLLTSNQPKAALLWATNNLACAKSLGTPSLITASLSYIGALYGRIEDYKKAILYMDSTLLMAQASKDTFYIYSTYDHLGVINTYLDNHSKALEWFKKASKLVEQLYYNGGNELVKVQMDLGGCYDHVASAYQNLANQENTKDYEDSIRIYYQKALQASYETASYHMVALTLVNLALNRINSGKNYQATLDSLDKAYQIAPKYIDWELTQHLIYSAKGFALTKLKKFTAAQQYLDSAEIIAHILTDTSIRLIEIYQYQKDLYLAKKDYKKAYVYEVKVNNLYKELQEQKEQKVLTNFETKYETEQVRQQNIILAKDRDIQQLRAKRNQRLIYAGLVLLLLIVIIFILLVTQFRIKAFYLTQKLNYQLLRNQMNPHFIFNSLGAIQSFVSKRKTIEAIEYIASFAELMRAILDNSSEEYVSLNEEIQWLENYLKLQLLRFEDQFDYTLNLDDNIDLEEIMIPPMLVQPFIENALEHGLKSINYKGHLDIKISEQNKVLQIDILDNGIGLDASKKNIQGKKHKSRATQITEERLKFLNKNQVKNIYFSIQPSLEKGTKVSFSIPYLSKF